MNLGLIWSKLPAILNVGLHPTLAYYALSELWHIQARNNEWMGQTIQHKQGIKLIH